MRNEINTITLFVIIVFCNNVAFGLDKSDCSDILNVYMSNKEYKRFILKQAKIYGKCTPDDYLTIDTLLLVNDSTKSNDRFGLFRVTLKHYSHSFGLFVLKDNNKIKVFGPNADHRFQLLKEFNKKITTNDSLIRLLPKLIDLIVSYYDRYDHIRIDTKSTKIGNVEIFFPLTDID